MESQPEGTAAPERSSGGWTGGRLHLTLSRRAQVVAGFLLTLVIGLLLWTIFLGTSLPKRYDASHWRLLWVGFDLGLLIVLSFAAWATWFRRQILAALLLVAATLLLCDAWFDIVTSIGHRDSWFTLLTGFGVELPLALLFFWMYRRVVMTTLVALHEQVGEGPPPRRLREVPIVQPRGRTESDDDGGPGSTALAIDPPATP